VAKISVAVAIEAPKDQVFALVRDQAQRARFLPDGWRFVQCVTETTDIVGSQMEIESRIGPTVRRVIELLLITDNELYEGPSEGDNFMTKWTFVDAGPETLVEIEMQFEYGGWLGEFLIKRRLREALTQQLLRLGALAAEQAKR
jgi:hypothetical protein